MRIGYLQLPHLPIQVALLRAPTLRGRPIVVGGDETRRGRVVDASPECLATGVAPGMTIREASEIFPSAAILPANPIAVGDVLGRALDLLDRFSEAVEEVVGDGAWLVPAAPATSPGDVRRLGAAIVDGLAATLGLEARIGFGPGKTIARIVAERATPGSVEIVSDNAAAYLAPLPISLLPLLPSAIERLKLLGVATIGDFARLPAETLPRRFGHEAALAARIARGDDDARLIPRQRTESLVMRRAFEPPLEDRGILLSAARELLDRLCRQLQASQRAFRAITLTASLEDGRLAERRADLRGPTNEPRHCLSVLQGMVETIELGQSVASLALRLSVLGREAATHQSDLFGGALGEHTRDERRAQVDHALTEINRRYRGRLRRISPGDDPHSLLDDRRLWLISDDPPGPADGSPDRPASQNKPSESASGPSLVEPAVRLRPIHLIARQGRLYLVEPGRPPGWPRDEIIALHARWEADDWWPEAARRTYYRIQTRRGLILTLARDLAEQRWLVIEKFD